MKPRIGKQFNASILLLSIILSVIGSVLVWRVFVVQKEQTIELQNEIGNRAKNEFIILTHELTSKLTTFSKLWDPLAYPIEQQQSMLSKLRSYKDQEHKDIIDEIVLFNANGQVVSSASRISLRPNPNNYPLPAFRKRLEDSFLWQSYLSPVSVDENGEPFIVLAVPLINFQSGKVKGILASRLRIHLIWDEMIQEPVGKSGRIYITDKRGQIVAHPDPSIVLRKVVLGAPSQTNFCTGLDGKQVIRTFKNVGLGSEVFSIYVDRPVKEALTLAMQSVIIISLFIFFFLAAGVMFGVFFKKKIIQPIELLARTAQKVESGDLVCGPAIQSDNELGMLSQAFNNMVTRLLKEISRLKSSEDALRESKNELEKRVEERTACLQQALDEVRTLRGILPICSSCKKIRDDQGYWNQIESYVSEHSEAEFTHSICNECARKFYPDYVDNDGNILITKT